VHRIDGHTISLRLDGPQGMIARFALLRSDGEGGWEMHNPRLALASGEILTFDEHDGRFEALVPAAANLILGWEQPG